jgi:hypothetical protein
MTSSEPTRTVQRAKTLLTTWRSIALNVYSQPRFTQQRHHTAHCTVTGIAPGQASQRERCDQARILRRWVGVEAVVANLQFLASRIEIDFFPLVFWRVIHVNTEQPSLSAGGGRALRGHASRRMVRGVLRPRHHRCDHRGHYRRVQRDLRERGPLHGSVLWHGM